MRRYIMLSALVAAVVGCPSLYVNRSGRPCEAGKCVGDYTCDAKTDTCITVGDACEMEGDTSPCEVGATDCLNGCRVCDDFSWTECRVIGSECVPGTVTCSDTESLVTCTDAGFIAESVPCGNAGCNTFASPRRCNDCLPDSTWCDGPRFVECGAAGLVSATTDCEAMPTLCAARLVCDDTLGCGTVDPVPSGTPCDDGLGTDGNWCNSACQSGACVPAMAAMCDDGNECTVDSCDPLSGCVATDLPLDTPCLGTNNDRCTASCDDRAQCVDLVDVMCDDALPCTIDICADGVCSYVPGNGGTICRPAADTCDAVEVCTGGSLTCPPDNPLMLVEAPASVPMRQQVTVTVTLPCANEAANLTCITNSKRFCLDGPLTFEGNQGNFVGSGVTNANCGADNVSTANCFNNNGGGDVLRIQQNSNAARNITVDATGFTNLRVHLKAAFPGTVNIGEVARIRGCCNAPGCTNEIGTANSYDDNGIDAWGDRPCRRTCNGIGYAFGAAFDNCPSVTNNIDWRATGSDEHVHIDNFAISGIGTLALQMNDKGDGIYTSSFAACVATTVTVTCTWTYRDGMTATTSVNFY